MSNVRDFGAVGDGLADDTEAILHAIENGDGVLEFSRGVYRITRTIEIVLDERGPAAIDGCQGTATIVMDGPGPAFRLRGTHQGTGAPGSVKPNVWKSQRLPTIANIEIAGKHPEADGVEMIETMQSVFAGVLIRQVRHGVHLFRRNRNVLISHCHIYDNTGIGVFLDCVNLHQINIIGNHISYNRLGGIRIERSEVRNLQITGNDIEYNNHKAHDTEPEPTAEIYIDTTAPKASVNEVTIASNTIQATTSLGGANIRILEDPREDRPPGLWAISGNIIGSQETNLHLSGCYGITVSGNHIYSCDYRNVLLENCSQINLTGNNFRRHEKNFRAGVRLVDSTDCVIQGCIASDDSAAGQESGASLLELERCRRVTVTGSQFLNGVPFGIDAQDCSSVSIQGCSVTETREAKKATGTIRFAGEGTGNILAGNTLNREAVGAAADQPPAGTIVRDNVIVD